MMDKSTAMTSAHRLSHLHANSYKKFPVPGLYVHVGLIVLQPLEMVLGPIFSVNVSLTYKT